MSLQSNNSTGFSTKEQEQYPHWLDTLTNSGLDLVALVILATVFSPVLVVFGAFSPIFRR
ncbi:hypothetical protein SpiGrapes_2324 [Sphaerochaeta pleomorpha str. Grapes]|uniref:Uncharacterized protein n=1 Tax=Sphaerochaeta pleomorpha (strain ATCC BAA-1885 / DSM 22778 / Grapes) TaxID=158190 RepID=G8QSG9_SPHPG|nr:hypothetical protein [Sphaerochaeta pleomorpha]AEV30099.1 hypothetical protein SpiGrapes_2324 [Sphaerochaeta pleomorpha str. Grapes]